MNFEFDIIQSDEKNETSFSREDIAGFLHKHLDEYGDKTQDILNCLAYAYGDGPGQDGFALVAHNDGKIMGVVIVNDTNMKGYIPEHILVYIAVHHQARGQGLGKALMKRAIDATDGNIALHVEPDNPARFLYEKFGFTNKYLEMRLNRE